SSKIDLKAWGELARSGPTHRGRCDRSTFGASGAPPTRRRAEALLSVRPKSAIALLISSSHQRNGRVPGGSGFGLGSGLGGPTSITGLVAGRESEAALSRQVGG